MKNIELTQEQVSYIIDKTGIEDKKQAVTYFAEVMMLEKIHPTQMSLYVSKMMEREKTKK